MPTPTWKAAYRVVLDDATAQSPALLQAWAKIDNASQEDWRGVKLTLATGAPMSYALDLHTPTYVDRPDVTGKLVSPVVTRRVEELVIEEREPRRRTLELLDSPAVELGVYVEGSSLPPGVGDKIRGAVRLRKEMAAVEEAITTARRKLDDVTARSYEIRENLRALEKVRTADDLRRKLVANLVTATQDSDQLTKEITAKSEALAAVRGRLQDAIRELQLDEPGAPKP